MKFLKHIPNGLTALNLVAGFSGLIFVAEGDAYSAALAVIIGAFFDFLDGFAARLLKVSSAVGKQLDSLADMVTFGVLPAYLMFSMLENIGWKYLPWIALLMVVASAYRLARFNIDASQKLVFKGMPTPAAALLVIGLVFAWHAKWEFLSFLYDSSTGLILFVLIVTYLLNAPVPFLSLKLSDYRVRANVYPLVIIIVYLITLIIFGLKGILPATMLYVILSLISGIAGKDPVSPVEQSIKK